MERVSKGLLAVAVSTALGAPLAAHATNGMNLEGYGPIATGMGGASMAYDNGTAAVMNNPATLGLMEDGNRLDFAIGALRPDVSASHPMSPTDWDSDGDAYYMPAFGWAHKAGQLTYGFAAFAQGGMGTEYSGGGSGTAFTQMTLRGAGADPSLVADWDERSEVGVMRLIIPLAFNVNEQLTVGGSIDWVRATMDLQMAMPASVMGDMLMNPNSTVGTIDGSLTTALMTMTGGNPNNLYGGYFDFSDSSDFSGETEGSGLAGKLGVTFKVNESLTVGATYHSETDMGDLTGSADMQVAFTPDGNPANAMVQTVPGKIKIKNFQWPSTFGVGVAFQPSERLMVAADVKRINWSDVMKDFKMVFTADGGMGDLNATMFQDWDDQTVYQFGAAFKATDTITLRAGANIAENPIPDRTVHYLFPAIVENHYTVGIGYDIPSNGEINFAVAYAPEVEVTGSNPTSNGDLDISHSQLNYQLMYSHRF
ncbi:MAG: OmpP1/FadL family transporter [Thiohalomonadaceae bacterium]